MLQLIWRFRRPVVLVSTFLYKHKVLGIKLCFKSGQNELIFLQHIVFTKTHNYSPKMNLYKNFDLKNEKISHFTLEMTFQLITYVEINRQHGNINAPYA